MAEATTRLETVKSMLGITGEYQDTALKLYISEVEQYLKDAGVIDSVIAADSSAGVIARGVCDLWNYGAGAGALSPYFKERAIQLALKPEEEQEEGGGDNGIQTSDTV